MRSARAFTRRSSRARAHRGGDASPLKPSPRRAALARTAKAMNADRAFGMRAAWDAGRAGTAALLGAGAVQSAETVTLLGARVGAEVGARLAVARVPVESDYFGFVRTAAAVTGTVEGGVRGAIVGHRAPQAAVAVAGAAVLFYAGRSLYTLFRGARLESHRAELGRTFALYAEELLPAASVQHKAAFVRAATTLALHLHANPRLTEPDGATRAALAALPPADPAHRVPLSAWRALFAGRPDAFYEHYRRAPAVQAAEAGAGPALARSARSASARSSRSPPGA
jgi:hypothetical protein